MVPFLGLLLGFQFGWSSVMVPLQRLLLDLAYHSLFLDDTIFTFAFGFGWSSVMVPFLLLLWIWSTTEEHHQAHQKLPCIVWFGETPH